MAFIIDDDDFRKDLAVVGRVVLHGAHLDVAIVSVAGRREVLLVGKEGDGGGGGGSVVLVVSIVGMRRRRVAHLPDHLIGHASCFQLDFVARREGSASAHPSLVRVPAAADEEGEVEENHNACEADSGEDDDAQVVPGFYKRCLCAAADKGRAGVLGIDERDGVVGQEVVVGAVFERQAEPFALVLLGIAQEIVAGKPCEGVGHKEHHPQYEVAADDRARVDAPSVPDEERDDVGAAPDERQAERDELPGQEQSPGPEVFFAIPEVIVRSATRVFRLDLRTGYMGHRVPDHDNGDEAE